MKPFYRRRSQRPARRSQQLTGRATLCRFYIGYSSLPSLICLPPGQTHPRLPLGGAEHRRWRCWGANPDRLKGTNEDWESTESPEAGSRKAPPGSFSLLSSGGHDGLNG
jgi:hypothetical protein